MALVGPIAGLTLRGTALALPGDPVDNVTVLGGLTAHQSWSDERLEFAAHGITETLGLARRHWTHRPGESMNPTLETSTRDLAIEAARGALADAGMGAEELGLVLCATSTPHRMTATVSAAVGAALGMDSAACVDTRGGCAAGLFALMTAGLYVQAGAGNVLVVGAETFSKIVPPEHKMGALSLGDGAAALVVGAGEGVLEAASFRTDGSLAKLISTDGAMPPTTAEIERGGYLLTGAPEELASALPEKYLSAIREVMIRAQIGVGDIDLFVPHQTSIPLVVKLASALGFEEDRVYSDGVGRHANIGAAGWMAGLAGARAASRFGPGARLLLAAVGGGMSWSAAVWRC